MFLIEIRPPQFSWKRSKSGANKCVAPHNGRLEWWSLVVGYDGLCIVKRKNMKRWTGSAVWMMNGRRCQLKEFHGCYDILAVRLLKDKRSCFLLVEKMNMLAFEVLV